MADKYCTICYGRGYYLDNFMRKQECKRCQSSSLAEREAKVRNDALREAANDIVHTNKHPEDNRTWVGERPYICEETAYRTIEALLTTEEKTDDL